MIQTRKFKGAAVPAAGLLCAILSAGSHAALMYDQNVTPDVIFGSGNANGSFTVDQQNGIELGLRGKLRHSADGSPQNIFNSNGDGTYSFNAGVAPTQSFPTAEWSFEWSVNSDYLDESEGGQGATPLSSYTYLLSLDTDPSAATDFSIFFDPITGMNVFGETYWDHALGNNSTGNGDGIVTDGSGTTADREDRYEDNLDAFNVAQNSWKAHWFFGPTFDPTLDATYDISLAAFGSTSRNPLAQTSIQIIVGDGGGSTEVPLPATLPLLGLGLCALRLRLRRRA